MTSWFAFMAIMNSINSYLLLRTTTSLVIVVLCLISPASCSNHPPPTSSPRVRYIYIHVCVFLVLCFCDFLGLCFFFFGFITMDRSGSFCRACYLRRKSESGRPRRAAITSATSATPAWRSRCPPCQVSQVPSQRKLFRRRFSTHHLAVTSTPITSRWVGNAAAKIAYTTHRRTDKASWH